MKSRTKWLLRTRFATRALAATALVVAAASHASSFRQTNLVTDDQAALTGLGFAAAKTVDPNLVNPWGLAESATGPFWTANQGSGTSTLYTGAGGKVPLTVAIPGTPGGPTGPTGEVFFGGTGFVLPDGAPARFLFANLDGTISGWNGTAGNAAVKVANAGPDAHFAVYTGLALASSGGASYLLAPDAVSGTIDVYDSNFTRATLAGTFTDPGPNPGNLRPFNVQTLSGKVFVTYAVPGQTQEAAPAGAGFVSEFNADGTFSRRVVSGGALSSPWGLAVAPAGFGAFGGSLLVGNFSDSFGTINAFSLSDGRFLGALNDRGGTPLVIPRLWGLSFGNGGSGGAADTLFFAAGVGDEAHGVFGGIDAVPEPAAWSMMVIGFGFIGATVRSRRLPHLDGARKSVARLAAAAPQR